MAAALQRVRDYLTLRAETKRASEVATEEKSRLAHTLIILAEQRRAAEVLWSGACPAHAFREVSSAFQAALSLGRARAGMDDTTEVARALELPPRATRRLVDAVRRVEALASPERDAEVTAEHARAFVAVRDAVEVLERALSPYARDDRGLRADRIRRQAFVVVVALAVLVSIAVCVRLEFRTTASASAVYSAKYDPANVLDHSPESEWLLPDQTAGWVDVQLSPSRRVSRVLVRNAHNSIYNDRATKDFTLELYGHQRLLRTVDGSFPALVPEPGWTPFDVGRVSGVDRVRLVVKSWFGNGGGIGDISVE